MTLEECIDYAENQSEWMSKYAMIDIYKDRSEYYRQLAEWLKALKEIWDSGDCNDCLHSKNCTIRPKLGQMVRYNCYQYERKIQNDNADN